MPAIAVGGPQVPPEQPSQESVKLRESYPILEWVADQFPESNLIPKDPILRYKTRIFIDTVTSKLVPAWFAFVFRDGTGESLIKGIEAVQKELDPRTKYAVSDSFTIADAASAPFIGRLVLALENDLGAKIQPGEGVKVFETLKNDEKYEGFWKYAKAIRERESFKSTFPVVS